MEKKMKYFLACLAMVAVTAYGVGFTQNVCAQGTTVVLPDGTMLVCTTYGTIVECTKI